MPDPYYRIARVDDLRGDGPHAVSVQGRDLVLIRVKGEARVFDGLCPHQGALLGEGELIDGTLICRNHRWRFDATTGERIGGSACLRAHPTQVVDGFVEVSLGSDASVTSRSSGRRPEDLPGPRAWPLVGNAMQLDDGRIHQSLEAWAHTFGSLYRIYLGRIFVIVTDPALIAEVLRRRPKTYRRINRIEEVFTELGVDGVFSAEGSSWRSQRKLAMGALSHHHLAGFYPTLREVAQRLLRRWQAAADSGEVLDVQQEMMRFTIDVTTRLAFSQQTDAIGGSHNELLRALDPVLPNVSRRLNAVFPYWRYVRLPRDRRLEQSLASVREWLEGMLAEARIRLEAEPQRAEHPRDFLEAMLVARDAQGRPYSNDRLFGNALTMLLAGEDTTANTLAWAIHFLLDSPADTQLVRTQIDRVLGDDPIPADMAAARDLELLEAVANETLRLEPVAPLMFFENLPETTLGDVQLPPGTAVCILSRVAGMDCARIEAPTEFRPSRWQDPGTAALMQRSGVFVPFGSGPRICPGRSLALLEIRLVLATILRNFEIERVGRSQDVGEAFGFTLTPTNLQIRLHARGGARV